ncbi:MAG: outer membrane protein assembly factor BamA [Pontiellaceae bacterium]|nr:outer membrane protein assembly factor BamA [Pontiellaceae bacterium]MBN2786675.1 outer membrane protein assembly factor BamA [Pontiellaceae bacterium]
MKKILAIPLISLCISSVFAETIKDIRIVNQAGERYDISSVHAFTSFTVGQEITDQETVRLAIADDVNRMRDSGRYSFVKAYMQVEEDGIVLVYAVTAKQRLKRIEIRGADGMGNRKVLQKSELDIGQFADDSIFEQAAAKIKKSYADFWYPDAKITWKASVDETLGTVDVVFSIDEGRKLGIKNILFEGNTYFEAGKLQRLLQQKEKKWHSFITHSGQYKENVADLDVFSIKSFYMNNGFLDVQVSGPELRGNDPKFATLTYHIDEGKQYKVGRISLSGMSAFPEEELRRPIRLRSGNIASYSNINAASEGLKAYYGNRGYIRVGVDPVFDADAESGVVDITYVISEGPIGYINKVNISGNERTADEVIRRELIVYPGEKYNRSRLQASESKLRNLQYFEIVTIRPEPTAESGKYDLNVQVKEQPTGRFAAGVGFSSVDSLVGYAELSQGNFSYRQWPPIGDGQKFKIRAQLGTKRNDLDISFIEPWFMDRKLSLGVDLYHREASYYSSVYDQSTDGVRLSLGKPLSRFTRGTLAYSIERFDVYDVDSTATPIIKSEEGVRTKSTLEYTWLYDSRDQYFNPTKGNKTSISPYAAGGAFGAQTDIYGVRIRSAQYWPLINDMVFNLRGQVESVEPFGNSSDSSAYGDGVPLFDRLFLGGSYTLRGFEYRDVGPQDSSTGDAIGGNSSAFATAELTYPLWDKIRGAAFYDWGFVNVDSWDFDPSSYNDNWGIGLRFNLPGFPLHLDYAWPITYDETYQDKTGRFNFLIGHTF